jgi:mannose-6-phosphate isomerase-like protein (cupin superfamily)
MVSLKMNEQLNEKNESVIIYDDLTGESVDASYGLTTFAIAPHAFSEPHSHQSEETWIVRSGIGYANIGSEMVTLVPGKRVTVSAKVEHTIVNESEAPLVVLSFWWREN